MRLYIDLIGLYYCVTKCGNVGVEDVILRELLSHLPIKDKVRIVEVWDKNVDLGENINKFLTDITGVVYNRTDFDEPDLCKEGRSECEFINCQYHKAYCCMCDAEKGDILVIIQACTEINCSGSPPNKIRVKDGIKSEQSGPIKCREIECVNCKFNLCEYV